MTEELKSQADYFKDEPIYLRKVIEELKQENKDFEILAKSLYKRIEELEKENEALAFRERLYKADYKASEQENKELKEEKEKYKPFYELGAKCTQLNEVADSLNNLNSKYKSALEEIRDKAGKILIEENKGNYWNLYEIISEILEKCLGVLDVKY